MKTLGDAIHPQPRDCHAGRSRHGVREKNDEASRWSWPAEIVARRWLAQRLRARRGAFLSAHRSGAGPHGARAFRAGDSAGAGRLRGATLRRSSSSAVSRSSPMRKWPASATTPSRSTTDSWPRRRSSCGRPGRRRILSWRRCLVRSTRTRHRRRGWRSLAGTAVWSARRLRRRADPLSPESRTPDLHSTHCAKRRRWPTSSPRFEVTLTPFRFRTIGQLAAIGRRTGVARIFGVNFSGFFAWWLWRTITLSKLPRLEEGASPSIGRSTCCSTKTS